MNPKSGFRLAAVAITSFACLGVFSGVATAQNGEEEFTTDFRLEDCKFKSKGRNPYFPLKPGHQLVLEGEDDGKTIRVEITVLHETERIRVPGLGWVRTRLVQEREWVDDELVEISRNFFVMCRQTNDVAYFGEDVDIFNEDGSITHEGQWRVEMGLEVTTEAGKFNDCVRVIETSPLEPGSESEKLYCPGVGLVADNEAHLVEINVVGPHDAENEEDDEEDD